MVKLLRELWRLLWPALLEVGFWFFIVLAAALMLAWPIAFVLFIVSALW